MKNFIAIILGLILAIAAIASGSPYAPADHRRVNRPFKPNGKPYVPPTVRPIRSSSKDI